MISRYTIDSVDCKKNIGLEKIQKYKLDYKIDFGERRIDKKEKVLEVEFTFIISYLDDIGSIKTQGKVYFSDTLKRLKEIDENWASDKESKKRAINAIFTNIVAMLFDTTRHMGLPSPVILPVFTPGEGI